MNNGKAQLHYTCLVTCSMRQSSNACTNTNKTIKRPSKSHKHRFSKIIFVVEGSLNQSNSQKPKTKQSKMKSHGQNVKKYNAIAN